MDTQPQSATQSADAGSDQSQTAVEQVKQQTQQVADQAQQAAGQAVQTAKQQAVSAAKSQKDQGAQNLSSVAQSLHQTAQQLQQQGQGTAGQYIDRAGDAVDSVASYLQGHTVQEIIGDAEDFARRQPGIFLGGAFALGFLITRFLKSSPPSQQTGGGQYGYAGGTYGQYGGQQYSASPGYAADYTGYGAATSTTAGYGLADTPDYTAPAGTDYVDYTATTYGDDISGAEDAADLSGDSAETDYGTSR